MNNFYIQKPLNFELSQIFDCGQCFRFNKLDESGNVYGGVAYGRYLKVSQTENEVCFHNCTKQQYADVWHNFFDLDTDYSSIIAEFSDDKALCKASEFSKGIRILKQDSWEALCSFIISQNNNIPRIKGIIENMSKEYGEKIHADDGSFYYGFPTAKALYEAGEQNIFNLKTGFRAKYIYDCARLITQEGLSLELVNSLPLNEALEYLMQIKGVGPKVASCALLFGFGKYDAFPIDVWVKKILAKYYSENTCAHFSGKYAGIAQQYLFYYERCLNNVYL